MPPFHRNRLTSFYAKHSRKITQKKYLKKYFAKSVTLLKKSCILNMRAKKTTGYGESA